MDEVSGYCKGCWRTVDEVASWLYFNDGEKLRIIEELKQRKRSPNPPSSS
jgi:predicted Fe-S protein YdhL (DUF1289 family)